MDVIARRSVWCHQDRGWAASGHRYRFGPVSHPRVRVVLVASGRPRHNAQRGHVARARATARSIYVFEHVRKFPLRTWPHRPGPSAVAGWLFLSVQFLPPDRETHVQEE